MARKTTGEHCRQGVLNNEERFHDAWADCVDVADVHVDEFFEACTAPENRLIMERLAPLSGKRVLELGAGLGEASVYMAKQGAEVTATDYSGGMLDVVQRLAAHHGVRVVTQKCSADAVPFDDAAFDAVYAGNLLHHVEIEPTVAEAARALKPGGVFVSWDPLAHNPLINLYRKVATDVRTADEHPLRMHDLEIFRRHFSRVQFHFTWFSTLAIFVGYYLGGVDPNKERYWKKIIVEHERLRPVYRPLEGFDRVLLRALPFLGRYCWNVVVCAEK